MASRTEARHGTDARGTRGGTRLRWIFAGAGLVTAVWVVVLILLARWLIVTIF
jgi:hypothetical protein